MPSASPTKPKNSSVARSLPRQGRFSVTTVSGGVSNLRSDGYGFDDRDRIAGGAVYKGYLWSDIAGHCAANLNCIPAKHHGFLADMAGKLGGHRTVSGAQAKYLGNLFSQYLSGRI